MNSLKVRPKKETLLERPPNRPIWPREMTKKLFLFPVQLVGYGIFLYSSEQQTHRRMNKMAYTGIGSWRQVRACLNVFWEAHKKMIKGANDRTGERLR